MTLPIIERNAENNGWVLTWDTKSKVFYLDLYDNKTVGWFYKNRAWPEPLGKSIKTFGNEKPELCEVVFHNKEFKERLEEFNVDPDLIKLNIKNQAASLLEKEVQEHRKDNQEVQELMVKEGLDTTIYPHSFCEDYGCFTLEDFAKKIRNLK